MYSFWLAYPVHASNICLVVLNLMSSLNRKKSHNILHYHYLIVIITMVFASVFLIFTAVTLLCLYLPSANIGPIYTRDGSSV